MTLTKADIVKSIQDQFGFPRDKSKDLLESVLETITQSLKNGEDVMISGFGKFHVTDKKARKGRNPQTGESMIIESRRIVSFRCSSRAREKLND